MASLPATRPIRIYSRERHGERSISSLAALRSPGLAKFPSAAAPDRRWPAGERTILRRRSDSSCFDAELVTEARDRRMSKRSRGIYDELSLFFTAISLLGEERRIQKNNTQMFGRRSFPGHQMEAPHCRGR